MFYFWLLYLRYKTSHIETGHDKELCRHCFILLLYIIHLPLCLEFCWILTCFHMTRDIQYNCVRPQGNCFMHLYIDNQTHFGQPTDKTQPVRTSWLFVTTKNCYRVKPRANNWVLQTIQICIVSITQTFFLAHLSVNEMYRLK